MLLGKIVAQTKLPLLPFQGNTREGFSVGVQAEVGDWHSDSQISRTRTKPAVTVDSCIQMKSLS